MGVEWAVGCYSVLGWEEVEEGKGKREAFIGLIDS